MHFKNFIKLFFISVIAVFFTNCDNTVIEPKIEKNQVDSAHSYLLLNYTSSSESRKLKLVSYKYSKNGSAYLHELKFDDGSGMFLETTSKFGLNQYFILTSANSLNGYTGYYARMEFYDEVKKKDYYFIYQNDGITTDKSFYNDIYYSVNFKNVNASLFASSQSVVSFNGTLALLP